MKKLLSLLSVLTISGSAIPTTIAASPYQKEENINNINYEQIRNLKRNKRELNDKNEIDLSPKTENYELNWKNTGTSRILITPNFWEELNQSLSEIQIENKLKSKIEFINNKTSNYFLSSYFYSKLSIMIKNNLDKINEEWEKSDKKHRIAIYYVDYSYILGLSDEDYWSKKFKYNSVKILNNENSLSNKYLDSLLKSFNNEINNNEINIGIIENENNHSILEGIKKKYERLDINEFEVKEIINYSYFIKGYFAKIKVKNNSEKYSKGILKSKFIFNTKIKIDEINNIISNDNKVKTWINHLEDWKKDVNNELKTSVHQKTFNEKIEWKNRKKEDLKTYIRDWSYIINLIENELKLQELNNTIEGIKQDISNIKSEINKINTMILSNSNDLLTSCSNYLGLISASTGWIPTIGTLISTVTGTASAICCAIANA